MVFAVAPFRALCAEKFGEWKEKFEKQHNLKCLQLTGDTDFQVEKDLDLIDNANIICTTPEKWDFLTRKWKQRRRIMDSVKLFLIDEIHVLGENNRGATIEAVVSRMKTYAYKNFNGKEIDNEDTSLRFVAISATFPNIEDIASWLGPSYSKPAIVYKYSIYN